MTIEKPHPMGVSRVRKFSDIKLQRNFQVLREKIRSKIRVLNLTLRYPRFPRWRTEVSPDRGGSCLRVS